MKSNETLLESPFWGSPPIYVVASLGIADLLRDEPRNCNDLAEATRTHASSLYRVMRTLASGGIFAEDHDGRFRLTPLSESLRSDAPGSLRDAALMFGQEWFWRAWQNMLHSVETGQNAFQHLFGAEMYEFFGQNPKAAAIFNNAMTSLTRQHQQAIVSSYDFANVSKIVDVGGGHGSLLGAILKAHPTMKGILFDLPSIREAAIGSEGLTDRCEFAAGNFFDAVPDGGDVYLLKQILHGWDDEHAAAILKNCCDAMSTNGRVLVIEVVIPSHRNTPSAAMFLDLLMLVWTHDGRERTEQEYRSLFATAGLTLTRHIETQSPFSLLEGRAHNGAR